MSSTAAVSAPPKSASNLSVFARDIKISHTVFAMPWAILSTMLAWNRAGGTIFGKLALILICMVTARTFAMAVNRLFDAQMDAKNPRTAGRALPSGKLSHRFFTVTTWLCVAIFVATTALFWVMYGNRYPLLLGPAVLGFLAVYPLLKRFTALCHFWLGAALALAPICAWVAIDGLPQIEAYIMAAAVLFWTAGFDIIYACQDYESDVECGVYSIPARLGIGPALWVSRAAHCVSAAMLLLLGWAAPELATLYFIGAAIAILLLIVEQSLVSPRDLSKAGLAFFTINGIISLLVGALGVVDTLL